VLTHGEVIRRLARLERLEVIAGEPPRGSAQFVIGEATAALPLEGLIDLDAERARLRKEVARLADEIAKVERKLGNADFVAKAPAEVVEENQERLAGFAELKAKTEGALARLES